jgi:hypothetical protein
MPTKLRFDIGYKEICEVFIKPDNLRHLLIRSQTQSISASCFLDDRPFALSIGIRQTILSSRKRYLTGSFQPTDLLVSLFDNVVSFSDGNLVSFHLVSKSLGFFVRLFPG